MSVDPPIVPEVPGGPQPDPGGESACLTVTQLNRSVRHILREEPSLQDVWVMGEFSNLKSSPSGHAYPTLKDESAEVRCVVWAWVLQTLPAGVRDGVKVMVHGKVDIYEPRGSYQLNVDRVKLFGVGELYARMEALKERLRGEGLFDRKRPLPAFPAIVGVVTSETGAALRDVLRILGRRFPAVHVILAPVLVQGVEASADFASGIATLNGMTFSRPEVLIVGRGGGSIEDLWAFNEEGVARAIFASQIPVISAVGHETDFTIADLVADRRAATPSEAAELVVPDAAVLMDDMIRGIDRLSRALADQLMGGEQQLDETFLALRDAMEGFLKSRTEGVGHLRALMESLDPHRVLKRGYSIVRQKGAIRSHVASLKPGEGVEIIMQDGEATAEVREVKVMREGAFRRTHGS